MKITVRLSSIFKLDTKSFEADIDSYRDLISALINLIPGFINILPSKILILDGDKLVRQNDLDFKPKSNIINIVPTISGGLSSNFDSLGNLNVFYGSTTAIGSQELALTGLDRRIVESSLFGKAQTAFDINQRAANRNTNTKENTDDPTTGFGSLTLAEISGQPIPLHFGLVRVGGIVINQYIKHIQRGGVDTVKVSDYT